MAVREEFERTRWLCKQNCDAMSDATGVELACHYRQGGLDLTYAACIDVQGCAGNVGGQCEEQGAACHPDSGLCTAQCNPENNNGSGNPDCLVFGYPSWYQCAFGWGAEGMCVPPECAPNPLGNGLDISECEQFVPANLY
jgi:hypothetical protein